MRVNISYSVELEEVLENLYLLFMREEAHMRNKIKNAETILKSDYDDENISSVANAINEYREAMASFDTKLAEISNILSGYYAIRYNPEPGIVAPQTDENEPKND